jgi:hypothetical protein
MFKTLWEIILESGVSMRGISDAADAIEFLKK